MSNLDIEELFINSCERKINRMPSDEWQKVLEEIVSQNYNIIESVHCNKDNVRYCAYLVTADIITVYRGIYEKLMEYLGIDTSDCTYKYVEEILKKRIRCTLTGNLHIFAYSEIKFEID